MASELHTAAQYRSALPGIEAFSLSSNRSFPRHAHDHFGIGVIHAGGHRSWSGVGQVEATTGDVITVNPGEMHDGAPMQGRVRSWRMLYLDPDFIGQGLQQDTQGNAEIVRPVLRDPILAHRFARLFVGLTTSTPDALELEEELLLMLAHLRARYGSRPLAPVMPPAPVVRAVRRLDEAPEQPVTLKELAGLSGVSRFQLLRGFARAVGATPHAYLLQQRVRLAQRLLAAGQRPADAAAGAGFADQSHLTRAFRRQLGITPARYRAAVT